MRTTSAITGLQTKYDVKTKCKVVKDIFTIKFSTLEDFNNHITSVAEDLMVNPATIKLWMSKYEHTYTHGMKLPDGVMSYSFLTVDNKSLPRVKTELNSIKAKLTKVRSKYEKATVNVPTAKLRSQSKPKDIINDLTEISI